MIFDDFQNFDLWQLKKYVDIKISLQNLNY